MPSNETPLEPETLRAVLEHWRNDSDDEFRAWLGDALALAEAAPPRPATCLRCGRVVNDETDGPCVGVHAHDLRAAPPRPMAAQERDCHHCNEQPPDKPCWWCGRPGTGQPSPPPAAQEEQEKGWLHR